MSIIYDKLGYNRHALLDLPFLEGTGVITQDVAKPHHPVTLVGAPSWSALDSHKMSLELDGATQYAQCLNAACADLGFTSSAFSIGGWFKWTSGIVSSQILIGRYELNVGGWELYLTNTGALYYLSLRLHHSAGLTTRTACYSLGWTPDVLFHFGVVRDGASAQFYRNGEAVTTVSDSLIDPEATTRDLVIGVRYTKDANFLDGNLARLFVADEALTSEDWLNMYKHQSWISG